MNDLPPFKIVRIRNDPLDAVVVIDNIARGPALGGVRMAPDASEEECARLARAMTLKNAAAGLAFGGGKAVIRADPAMERTAKEQLVRRFASAIRWQQDYIPGPDMGTDEQCMAWVKDEIGRAAGLPEDLGGLPLDEMGATGYGLYHSVDVALQWADFGLEGATVAVQGFGAVGIHAARFLTDHGATLVAAGDSRGMIRNDAGLDLVALVEHKKSGQPVATFGAGDSGSRDDIIGVPCDIWVPAARPDVIDEDNVDRVDAKLIPQGANIPITVGAERILEDRGVILVPDYIANAGGVICAAVEIAGGSRTQAFDLIREKLRANTEAVLARREEAAVSARDAADQLAVERVENAMALRRWRVT